MTMDKIANVGLETTSQYQSIAQLNVQFWNQDKGTAVLQFQITRNNFPLSLSKENVDVLVKLESGDNYIVDHNLQYVDELNGVVSYTIPTEFLRVANDVTGQVSVTTKDGENVVVQRKFTFTVADDLLSDIPATEKLKEIRLFNELREEVAEEMTKLNDDFANMNDYVSQVQQTTTDGVNQINTLTDNKLNDYNENHSIKMNELTTTGDGYTTQITDDKNYIDNKMTEFEQKVIGSDVVTQGEAQNWQKYKFSNDDGTYIYKNMQKNLEAYRALPPGNYYTAETPISGMGQTSAAGFTRVDERNDNSVKHITFRPYNSSQEFLMRFYNQWDEWEIISPDYNKMETINGAQAKANTAESNAKAYTDKVASETNEVIFMGLAKNIGSTINLSKPFTDYDELKIFVYGSGGAETYIRDTDPDRKIIMHSFNITNSDASNGDIVETHIEKNSPTSLEITHVGSYNLPTNSGNTDSTLGVEVYKIVGVRYHENLSQS